MRHPEILYGTFRAPHSYQYVRIPSAEEWKRDFLDNRSSSGARSGVEFVAEDGSCEWRPRAAAGAGAFLRALREDLWISRTELSDCCGLDRATLSRLEAGRDMRFSTLARITASLGATLELRARFRRSCDEIAWEFVEQRLRAPSLKGSWGRFRPMRESRVEGHRREQREAGRRRALEAGGGGGEAAEPNGG